MVSMRLRFGALVAVLYFFTPLVSAQNFTTTNTTVTPAKTTIITQSTFYLPETQTQFSISINNSTTQDAGVYIYFTSPAYSWVGVGFGSTMQNSLMFIMYPSAKGNSAVFSPRTGSKNAEPSWDPSISFLVQKGTGIDDDMMTLRVKCANCIRDIGSDPRNVPMMYAFGPGSALYSNEYEAGLKRHVRYGHFTMDLVAATGNGGVPGKSDANSGVTMVGEMVKDRDYRGIVHAVLGCLALFVIWPLNVLVAGFIKSRRWHVGVSIVIFVFLIVAFAVGGALSPQYNRSKAFKSPHQILAFVSLIPIFFLSVLPIPPIQRLYYLIPRIHAPLVTATFFVLVISGGLGLQLSSQPRPIILAYTAVSLLVFVFTFGLDRIIRKRGSARQRQRQRARNASGEEDDIVEMLKMGGSRAGSSASLRKGSAVTTESREVESDEQRRGQRGIFGGGTMPGPDFMLNMHPGVPVHRW